MGNLDNKVQVNVVKAPFQSAQEKFFASAKYGRIFSVRCGQVFDDIIL